MPPKFEDIFSFIRALYKTPDSPVYLHEPRFQGNEIKYVTDAIRSTYVSSVGKYVNLFEDMIKDYTGASYAVATVNGSAALHISLLLAGVKRDELVITQPLSFIATCNCISYIGAEPLFVDISLNTLGISASKLQRFFEEKTVIKNNNCFHSATGKRIAACVPMHTFGHPCELDEINELCKKYCVPLVEDAAESIGSKYKQKHTGRFGLIAAFSFNGNKTITSGGGGVIITDDERIAKLAKHLTTQAKMPHAWEFVHDQIGYNYRLPNLNAALACAQMEQLDTFVTRKREVAKQYKTYFSQIGIEFVSEPKDSQSNYWLNAILLKDEIERDLFLTKSNKAGIMSRPCWRLMNRLEMFKDCICENIDNAVYIENRLVNLPSSVIY